VIPGPHAIRNHPEKVHSLIMSQMDIRVRVLERLSSLKISFPVAVSLKAKQLSLPKLSYPPSPLIVGESLEVRSLSLFRIRARYPRGV
jgi:hypothetical protein